MAGKEQARHKGLYDRRCKGAALDIGDLVLVKKTAWKGRHKIHDRWESDEYQVIGQSNPGIPVYEVKCVAGGRTRVLHCNLLLPLQGRLRQQGGEEVGDPKGPEEEEEEDSRLPGVPKAPQVRPGKRPASPQEKPTQHMEASGQDASVDLKSKDSSAFRLLPESLLTIDRGLYRLSHFPHNSTLFNHRKFNFPLGPISSRVEGPKADSKTEGQFSSSMPYLEESTPLPPLTDINDTPSSINVSDSHDSVFVSDHSPDISSSAFSPDTPMPIPQRSTRNTKGKPPKRYGKVYTFDTLVDMGSYFQCPCDYCTGK